MRCVIVLISVFLLPAACFAQQEHRDSKWHFSFTLPEGWEVITDDIELEGYALEAELRSDDKIVALCREKGAADKAGSIVVQARTLGDDAGLGYEDMLEESLSSNYYRSVSQSYIFGFEKDLVDKGLAKEVQTSKFQIWYDKERRVYFETVATPLIAGGAVCESTVRLLGSNRVVTLSFSLHGTDVEGPYELIEELVNSFSYDKNYGFGEAPATSVLRTVWFWLFPGVGTLIVMFFLYKWVASEYG